MQDYHLTLKNIEKNGGTLKQDGKCKVCFTSVFTQVIDLYEKE